MTKEDEEAEWEKTRDIDNPLHPWIQVFNKSLFNEIKVNNAEELGRVYYMFKVYKGELCRV